MSIFQETCYGLICDRCEQVFEHPFTGYSLWTNQSAPIEESTDRDWIEHEGKHYCPECYIIDEETDEITIK